MIIIRKIPHTKWIGLRGKDQPLVWGVYIFYTHWNQEDLR